MKLRKKKISIIISVLILLMLSLATFGTSAVQASMSGQNGKTLVNRNGQEYPKNFISAAYPYFCIKHGFPVKTIFKDGDTPSEALAYKKTTVSDDIEPSIGYAAYCLKRLGLTQQNYKEEMQDIIWSSRQWGNESNVLDPASKNEYIDEEDMGRDFKMTATTSSTGASYSGGRFPLRTRSYLYGTVYYGIIGSLPKSGEASNLFTVTPANSVSSDDLKLVVDQSSGQYTVGPYKLKINAQSSASKVNMSLAKKALYAELTKNRNTEGYVNIGYNDKIKFAWFDITKSEFFSGLNGTDYYFVDQYGNRIEFPNFVDEKEFYVRFKPNDNGAIVTTGTPKITIKYITRFPGSFEKFTDGEFVKDHLEVKISKASDNIVFKSVTYEEDSGTFTSAATKIYNATAICDIIVESSKGGRSWKTTIKDVTIYMQRRQRYTKSENKYNSDGTYKNTEYYFPPCNNFMLYQFKGFVSNFVLNLDDLHVSDDTTNVQVSGPACVQASIRPAETNNGVANVVQTLILNLDIEAGGGEHGLLSVDACSGKASFKLAGKDINMQLGGHVFLDVNDEKDNKPDGRYTNKDKKYGGVEVKLYESGSRKLIATTTTDNDGQYRFYGLKDGKPMINPLLKYYVTYTYNGQLYQQTYYKEGGKTAWSGGWSNAKEIDREGFNNRFETIYSESANYKLSGDWRKSFALDQKLERENQDYISYNGSDDNKDSGNYLDMISKESGALTYRDVWNHFIKIATYSGSAGLPGSPKTNDGRENWGRSKEYGSVYNELESWLSGLGVSSSERRAVIQFIKDCQITAETIQVYPIYDKFILGEKSRDIEKAQSVTGSVQHVAGIDCYYLYNNSSDQSRWVDFGINKRVNEDLALQKDVYKATVLVNGKKEEYIYNKKQLDDDGIWQIDMRASDVLYNGSQVYSREIRRSEYLYDGSDAGTDDAKNMKVYVTYRIAVKNFGSVDTKVREIVDYYDADAYEFDGVLNSTGNDNKKSYNEYNENGEVSKTYINSFVGSDHKGGRIYEETAGYNATTGWQNDQLVVKSTGIKNDDPSGRNKATINGANYNYTSLYLTGKSGAIQVSHTNENGSKYVDDTLHPGEIAYVYLTFKVKNDTTYNRVLLDQDLNTGTFTLGKKNIAEINAYSTYYKSGDTIPDHLNSNNEGTNDKRVGGKTAGLVDLNSNPGSLKARDLNENGDIITDRNNRVNDRQQNDSDKAPNIRLIINMNNSGDDVRTVSGLVYEDARNTKSDDAIIGNGIYDENDTIINGVTLQLVELVQDVDADGMSKHTYNGEKVWVQHEYQLSNNLQTPNRSYQYEANNKWYYSGAGKPYIIINGDGPVLHVSEADVQNSAGAISSMDGKYIFASMPAGDFYVRFMYGDTDNTALTNTNNAVNVLTKLSGMNAKSYNGQDYKSTTYQTGIEQTDVVISRDGNTKSSYNGIEMYKRTGDSVVTGDSDNNAQNFARTSYQKGTQISFNADEYGVNNPTDTANLDNLNIDAGTDVVYSGRAEKANMYYYDIYKADIGTAGISDAKDVWYYRDRSNEWSKGVNTNITASNNYTGYKQSLLNNRAEILRAFDYVSTYKGASDEELVALQKEMIKTLEAQTFGVATTGIINTEVERNTQVVGGNGDEYEYKNGSQITDGKDTTGRTSANSKNNERNDNSYAIKDVDFGLVERPEAQLKLNKEVTNFKIVLANNQILFDASSSVKNLYFSKHEGHHIYNSEGDNDKIGSTNETQIGKRRLASVAVSSNSRYAPELLQTYIDDELTEGATMQVTYKFTLENSGEVDYLDKQFYYKGNTTNKDQVNVSRTNANTVVDYVSNMLKYDSDFQEEGSVWSTWGANEGEGTDEYGQTLNNGLTNSTTLSGSNKNIDNTIYNAQYAIGKLDGDYVNRQYYTEISTYNTMLTTNRLSEELLPVRYDHGSSSIQTSLVLSTKLSSNNTGDNLIYNNLTEIIETTNTVGRRMQYSIVGNQEMADQSLGNNASSDVYTSLDLVTPTEIDADSAQKIVLMPPTGEDRDYLPIIITAISAVSIIAIAVIVIKTKVLNKNREK